MTVYDRMSNDAADASLVHHNVAAAAAGQASGLWQAGMTGPIGKIEMPTVIAFSGVLYVGGVHSVQQLIIIDLALSMRVKSIHVV